jgi:NAD(P)-dependent dehydrogenase (short-subunit alcohol dehydrogenase family)
MNNVGTLTMGWPHEVPLTEWQRVIDVNLLTIVRSIRVFVPLLVEQGEGHLVNTSSTSGLYPYAFDRLPYAATKAAVVALSECLALYLRPRGVGISCLCPGAVVAEKSNFAKEQIVVIGDSPPPLRRSPAVPADPDDIGELVVEAIEQNTFLVLPQPDVRETILRKWQDPDDFLDTQIRELGF